jgi:hypothetical protein
MFTNIIFYFEQNVFISYLSSRYYSPRRTGLCRHIRLSHQVQEKIDIRVFISLNAHPAWKEVADVEDRHNRDV